MKNVSIILLLLQFLMPLTSSAQIGTDLEFNQVVNSYHEYTGAQFESIGTVPSGKIWKLTGFTYSDDSMHAVLKINGNAMSLVAGGENGSLPLFFNENDILEVSTGPYGKVYLSFIEYSVVP